MQRIRKRQSVQKIVPTLASRKSNQRDEGIADGLKVQVLVHRAVNLDVGKHVDA